MKFTFKTIGVITAIIPLSSVVSCFSTGIHPSVATIQKNIMANGVLYRESLMQVYENADNEVVVLLPNDDFDSTMSDDEIFTGPTIFDTKYFNEVNSLVDNELVDDHILEYDVNIENLKTNLIEMIENTSNDIESISDFLSNENDNPLLKVKSVIQEIDVNSIDDYSFVRENINNSIEGVVSIIKPTPAILEFDVSYQVDNLVRFWNFIDIDDLNIKEESQSETVLMAIELLVNFSFNIIYEQVKIIHYMS